jgi:bud site selection protein 31
MPKAKRSSKGAPPGWDLIEPHLFDFERRMRDAESAGHEGKRKAEAVWPIFRIHHQRSRFVYDAYYRRGAKGGEVGEEKGGEDGEGFETSPALASSSSAAQSSFATAALSSLSPAPSSSALPPRISRELYEYCLREGHADAALIAKWKKQGYERLCCLQCVQARDHQFTTACVCRVPRAALEGGKVVECAHCGCRGCASGDGAVGVERAAR